MQDLTTGSVTSHLLKTTSFMLVSMLVQTLYFLVDLYWVGRLGPEAVAGVAVAGNLMFIVLAVSQMLGVGTTTLVAHASGRRDRDDALLVFNQSQVLSMLVAVGFLAAGLLTTHAYTRTVAADAGAAAQADNYLRWYIPAMALQFGIVAMGSALRGSGNFKPGMIVQSATVVLNMILAPFFIFGWGTGHAFGVAGAAMSTFVSIVIGSVWMVFYFLPKDAYLQFTLHDWRPRFPLWWRVLKIGLPAGAEFALTAVNLIVIYVVIRPFGAESQAGFGVGQRIVQAGFMPVVALGFAAAPVAGQNFGARKFARVRETFRSAALLAAGVMVALAIVCQIVPGAMIGVFSTDPRVLAVGEEYLRIGSLSFVASGLVFVAASLFQAMGNTLPSLAASFTRIVLLVVPAFLLVRVPGFELRWLWYLSLATVVVQLAMSLLLLRREFRRKLGDDSAAVVPELPPPVFTPE